MAWMAPILLVQVGVIQPVCLAVLDMEKARKGQGTLSVTKYLTLPIRNPITVGIVLGLIVNITGARLPAFVTSPVGMVGNMAVPMMLIMLGVSLRLDPRPGRGRHAKQVWAIQVLKVVVHPLAAYTVGRFGFGLDAADLFAVTVIAALPTAQNVFVISSRYRVGEALARDSVFWSTLLTVGSIFCIAVLPPS
jgi:predicted permease